MKKRISRPYRFQYRGIASSAEHNAEHDLFVDSINELYGIFDYENGNFTLPASSVIISNLQLDDFLLVGHNPDGTLKLPPMPNFTINPAPNAVPMANNSGKISVNWLPLGHNSGLNADTVDNYHASQVPAPNAIPVAGANGKIDPAWLPAGAGGSDADTVDGFHASQTPAASTIPVSGANGKLNVGWLPTGHNNGLDADTVDTFHASQTPTANTIPVAGSGGKLAIGWLPASATPTANTIPIADANGKLDAGWLPATSSSGGLSYYSRLTVGTTLPASGNENDLFYRTTDNKLFVYRGTSWTEIDWLPFVQASPEWIAGRLRVQGGQLQVSPNGTNWYNCIPAVGASVIELMTVDNTSYTRLYWIAPMQTVIVKNANHVPIVYAKDAEPVFYGLYAVPSANTAGWSGLRPSNTAISNGMGQAFYGYGSNPWAERVTGQNIVPLLIQETNEIWGASWIQIRSSQMFFGNGVGQMYGGYGAGVVTFSGTASSASYWLGTWYRAGTGGSQFTVPKLTLTRVA